MTRIRLKYLHCFTDQDGRARCYFRYRGQRWPLPTPGTEGFASAYDGLLAHIKANPSPKAEAAVSFMPGSMGWCIEKFLASPAYSGRADSTRRNYRRVLDKLKQEYGAGLLRDLQSRHVRIIRNGIANTSKVDADIAMSLVSALWNFAIEQLGVNLDADPTQGVKRVHVGEREHEPWPSELIERFMREARPPLRHAVKLALHTGQRRSDLVRMKWSDFDGECVKVRQQKTGAVVAIPCAEALHDIPRVADTILVGERGASLAAQSLSVMIRKALRKMGVAGYSIHGLRKNAANALAEAGCTDREIMAITGHRSLQMVSHYSKRADQHTLARSAIGKLESGKPKNATG